MGKRGLLRFYFNQLDVDQRAAAFKARQPTARAGAAQEAQAA